MIFAIVGGLGIFGRCMKGAIHLQNLRRYIQV